MNIIEDFKVLTRERPFVVSSIVLFLAISSVHIVLLIIIAIGVGYFLATPELSSGENLISRYSSTYSLSSMEALKNLENEVITVFLITVKFHTNYAFYTSRY
jgi:hypothetical protein